MEKTLLEENRRGLSEARDSALIRVEEAYQRAVIILELIHALLPNTRARVITSCTIFAGVDATGLSKKEQFEIELLVANNIDKEN